jgi:CDP-6-deoxy-D-xylo-4-hexulose-3-dehydrase
MFSMGKEVFTFEEQFAKYTGSKHCVMVNSGSSANLIMIGAMFYKKNNPWKIGDEVLVPAVSWPTTYYPLYQYGLKIKFIDIDLETLNFDLNALEKAITPKTKGILAVNLLGNPNDFDRIQSMIKGRDIVLLEDNCESLGATFKGKQAGTFGDMGTFSFFFSHHISTMEGGMVVTDDEELHQILVA